MLQLSQTSGGAKTSTSTPIMEFKKPRSLYSRVGKVFDQWLIFCFFFAGIYHWRIHVSSRSVESIEQRLRESVRE